MNHSELNKTKKQTEDRRQKDSQWDGVSSKQLTLSHLFTVFHRFEVDGGDGTDHLHGFSFHQTGVLLVPTSPFQIQTSDKYSILKGVWQKRERGIQGRVRWEILHLFGGDILHLDRNKCLWQTAMPIRSWNWEKKEDGGVKTREGGGLQGTREGEGRGKDT